MDEILKPCPFCGSRDVARMRSSDDYKFVECDDCGPWAKINDPEARPSADESAAKAWNTRTQAQSGIDNGD
jgi:Lar family restriction alleviation protein